MIRVVVFQDEKEVENVESDFIILATGNNPDDNGEVNGRVVILGGSNFETFRNVTEGLVEETMKMSEQTWGVKR